jgi:hypothetical protein
VKVLKKKGAIELKERKNLRKMKEGALITIANSCKNIQRERGATKFKEAKKLKKI